MAQCITHIHTAHSAVETVSKTQALEVVKSLLPEVLFVTSNDKEFQNALSNYLQEVK